MMTSSSRCWEEDDWEAIDDDGFVYKRRKRLLRPDPPPTTSSSASSDTDRKNRRRKRETLLKLRQRYQTEISHWEILSNTFNAIVEKTQIGLKMGELGSNSSNEMVLDVGLADLSYRRRIDELAIRVEADHAIIQGMSSFCDTAEAICSNQEQHLQKEYLSLPIWASPREMMAVLCGENSQADNDEGDPRLD